MTSSGFIGNEFENSKTQVINKSQFQFECENFYLFILFLNIFRYTY